MITGIKSYLALGFKPVLVYEIGMKLKDFPGIQRNVLLRGYSTFNVGGEADYFYNLSSPAHLPEILTAADQEGVPVFLLGGGSNVLFMDEGFRGLVIRLTADQVMVEGSLLRADAGAKWPAILRAMRETGLSGLEPFDGLPGTLGGAVAGNAGCFGIEIKDMFDSATLYDRAAQTVRTVTATDLEFRYRHSRIKSTQDVVLSVVLRLHETPALAASSAAPLALGSHLARLAKQPPGRSSGSFFKNPSPDRPAGLLIDQCGLKGYRIGGAQISPKHGNFFMNVTDATAHDLLALRDLAVARVQQTHGLTLETEVVIVPVTPSATHHSNPL